MFRRLNRHCVFGKLEARPAGLKDARAPPLDGDPKAIARKFDDERGGSSPIDAGRNRATRMVHSHHRSSHDDAQGVLDLGRARHVGVAVGQRQFERIVRVYLDDQGRHLVSHATERAQERPTRAV